MKFDLKMIKIYLKNHGYTDGDLNKLDEEKIFELYKTQSLQRIFEFKTALGNQNFSVSLSKISNNIQNYQKIKEKIEEMNQDISKIYDIFDEFVYEYTYEDFLENFRLNLPDISSIKIERILKVKYREFQEIWLEKIKNNFFDLPDEEKLFLINFYEKNRNDIENIKRVYQSSMRSDYMSNIKKISEIKLEIIKNFMPNLMEENYKDFFKETPQKVKIIKEILELTSSYSRSFLLELDMEKLEFLRDEIIKQNKKEIYDKKVFLEYVKNLVETINLLDDNDFEKVCLEVITKLDETQIQNIINYMCSKNNFFINKFNAVIRSHQSKLKNKGTYLFKNTH